MNRPRVLYVDGQLSECRALTDRFVSSAFAFWPARNEAAAVRRLESASIQVVVVRHRSAGLDAIHVLAAAKRLRPRAYRLLVTDDTDSQLALAAVNEGSVHRVISGAWTRRELTDVIPAYVERSRGDQLRRLQVDRARQREAHLDELRALVEALTDAQSKSVLDVLMAALALRESEAPPHCRRTAVYAVELGRALGLAGAELITLELGVLLHDIGKIGVSDHILGKPGSLSRDEWVQMKRHPAMGYGLLGDFPMFQAARTIVLQHHERWDGSGYPTGVTGGRIHLGARICSLADSLDAMTSHRPYREALPFELAWDEILACRGSQFDPDVVDRFAALGAESWNRTISGQRRAGSRPARPAPAPPPVTRVGAS